MKTKPPARAVKTAALIRSKRPDYTFRLRRRLSQRSSAQLQCVRCPSLHGGTSDTIWRPMLSAQTGKAPVQRGCGSHTPTSRTARIAAARQRYGCPSPASKRRSSSNKSLSSVCPSYSCLGNASPNSDHSARVLAHQCRQLISMAARASGATQQPAQHSNWSSCFFKTAPCRAAALRGGCGDHRPSGSPHCSPHRRRGPATPATSARGLRFQPRLHSGTAHRSCSRQPARLGS